MTLGGKLSNAAVRRAMKQAEAAAHRRPRADEAIQRRRKEEDYLNSYKQLQEQNFKLRNLAHWEEQTDQAIQRNQVRSVVKKLQNSQQHRVNHRRKQLRALLNADAKVYEAELDALRESPAERRQRLRERAQEIRNAKEKTTKSFVQEQYRKQFRSACDDLRNNEGKNVMLQCDKDRRQNLRLKYLYDDLKKREENKWAIMWEQDRQNKIMREKIEAEQRKEMNQKTFEEIDVQVRALQARRIEVENQKQRDTMERVEQIRRDMENAKIEAKRQADIAAERRMEVTRFNLEFQARKAAERKAQEDEDKKLLANVLEKEAAETADEHAKKMALAKDMREYLAYRERQRQENARIEAELDRLRNAELKKAADKQDMIWHKEDLARKKLLREVLEHRELQMLEKDAERKRKDYSRDLERQMLNEQLANDTDTSHEDRIQDLKNKAEMARILKSQMEDNQYRREMDIAERQYEKRAAELAEQRYQEQLRREMEYDRANLGKDSRKHNLKSMNWFS